MTHPPENPQECGLDGALADLLDLGLLAKHAHWNLVGPRFAALHSLLDELAEFACQSADLVAERAITLGHPPDGRAVTVVARSSLPTVAPGLLLDTVAIPAFEAAVDVVADRIHSVLDAFDADLVTVDLFTHMLGALETYSWRLRAQRSS
jgi:starvation-inducible DNA-binding protein